MHIVRDALAPKNLKTGSTQTKKDMESGPKSQSRVGPDSGTELKYPKS